MISLADVQVALRKGQSTCAKEAVVKGVKKDLLVTPPLVVDAVARYVRALPQIKGQVVERQTSEVAFVVFSWEV